MRRALAITSALLLAACGQGGSGNETDNGQQAENRPAAATERTLGTLLAADPRFAQLVQAAGMQSVLDGKAPYTVLVPTPEALEALPAGTLERLQQPANRAELTGLLRRHILPGTILAEDLARATQGASGPVTLPAMAGEPLPVTREGETLSIGGARLVGAEQRASNGVIHRIASVLPAPEGAGASN